MASLLGFTCLAPLFGFTSLASLLGFTCFASLFTCFKLNNPLKLIPLSPARVYYSGTIASRVKNSAWAFGERIPMPARCTKGFLFEDDWISMTLHARLSGLDEFASARKLSSMKSLEERWRIHCETCPLCSRHDTPPEASLREEYQWKRAQFHGALTCDVARLPTSGLSVSSVRQTGVASTSTRLLLGELEHLRRRLLTH